MRATDSGLSGRSKVTKFVAPLYWIRIEVPELVEDAILSLLIFESR